MSAQPLEQSQIRDGDPMSEQTVERRRSDLTVGVSGRAVGARDLALGFGGWEGLEVGLGELDGLRIWPRRRLRET